MGDNANGTNLAAETEAQLAEMWNVASQDIVQINPAQENWKIQTLPLARIKKIMKSEELMMQEVAKEKEEEDGIEADRERQNVKFMISGEAPVLMSKACELIIKELAVRAWQHTERSRRRTLQRQDLHQAVSESEVYDFLIDIIPRVATVNARTALLSGSELPAAPPVPNMHMGLIEPGMMNMPSMPAPNMNPDFSQMQEQMQNSHYATLFQPPVNAPAVTDGNAESAGVAQQQGPEGSQQPPQQWTDGPL